MRQLTGHLSFEADPQDRVVLVNPLGETLTLTFRCWDPEEFHEEVATYLNKGYTVVTHGSAFTL